jgi:Fe-S oxidoreductase
LLYLQSYLSEAGHDVLLANFSGWSTDRIARKIAEFKPEIAGISQWTHNRHASLSLARSIKSTSPKCMIVLGGGHATFSYHSILTNEPDIDLVVMGEGEITFRELADSIAGKTTWQHLSGIAFRKKSEIVVNAPQKPILDLDLLPFPTKYIEHSAGVNIPLQAEFVLSARGCPSTCHFCSSPAFWPRHLRFRSPEKIVDEILYLRDRLGLIYFLFATIHSLPIENALSNSAGS